MEAVMTEVMEVCGDDGGGGAVLDLAGSTPGNGGGMVLVLANVYGKHGADNDGNVGEEKENKQQEREEQKQEGEKEMGRGRRRKETLPYSHRRNISVNEKVSGMNVKIRLRESLVGRRTLENAG